MLVFIMTKWFCEFSEKKKKEVHFGFLPSNKWLLGAFCSRLDICCLYESFFDAVLDVESKLSKR